MPPSFEWVNAAFSSEEVEVWLGAQKSGSLPPIPVMQAAADPVTLCGRAAYDLSKPHAQQRRIHKGKAQTNS